jgi:hypothetical protein
VITIADDLIPPRSRLAQVGSKKKRSYRFVTFLFFSFFGLIIFESRFLSCYLSFLVPSKMGPPSPAAVFLPTGKR